MRVFQLHGAASMWKTKNSKIVYSNKYWKIRKNHFVTSANYEGEYDFVDVKGGVIIIPITNDNRILLTKQYRYTNGGYFFEFPAGGVEENPYSDAFRELQEETGFIAGSLEKVGHFYPYTGLSNEVIYLYLAYNLQTTTKNTEKTEEIESFYFSYADVNTKLISTLDGKAITAWQLAKDRAWKIIETRNENNFKRLENWDNLKDVTDLKEYVKKGRILEVGCGSGKIIEELNNLMDSEFTGIDINEYLIKKAKEKDLARSEFFHGELLDFNDSKKYDTILFRDSVHEMLETQGYKYLKKIFNKCFQLLNENGVLIIRDGLTPQEKIIEFTATKHQDFIENFRGIKKNKEKYFAPASDFINLLSKLSKIDYAGCDNGKSKYLSLNQYLCLLKSFTLIEKKFYKFDISKLPYINLKGELPASYIMLVLKKQH